MKRTKTGPLDLATISSLNNEAPHSFWVCDTAGPMQMTCKTNGCETTKHVAIFVQTYFRRVLLYLIPDLTIDSIINAVKALVSTEGKVVLLATDPAASFKPLAADWSPLKDDEKVTEKQIKALSAKSSGNIWLTLLENRYITGINQQGVRLRISGKDQSHLQGLAE